MPPIDLSNIPSFILGLLAVAVAVGSFFAMRQGYDKRVAEIQERVSVGQARVIAAYKEEVEGLRREIADLKEDRATQDEIIAAIRHLLGQHGLRIIISGTYVTLEDRAGRSKITRIREQARLNPIKDESEEIS